MATTEMGPSSNEQRGECDAYPCLNRATSREAQSGSELMTGAGFVPGQPSPSRER